MDKQAKNTICLWYDGDAEDAARFYAETFPDSSVEAVHLAPGDFPSGKKGDVLTVEFTVMGVPCGAELHEYGDGQVGVTAPTEMPEPASAKSMRACT